MNPTCLDGPPRLTSAVYGYKNSRIQKAVLRVGAAGGLIRYLCKSPSYFILFLLTLAAGPIAVAVRIRNSTVRFSLPLQEEAVEMT